MILNSSNIKNICCEFDLDLGICNSNNYIIAKYNSTVTYDSGFKNVIPLESSLPPTGRKGINYIIKGGSIFSGDESLTIKENETIEIHFYPNITTLQGFFFEENSQSIISVDLSHFDSSLVTNMEGVFAYCFSIEEIHFTNFNTSSVKSMSYFFALCYNLKSLDLSGFQTSKVKTFSYMFYDCLSLEYLDISNFDFGASSGDPDL